MAVKIKRADEFKAHLLDKLEEDRRTVLTLSLSAQNNKAENGAALALIDLMANYIRQRWDDFLAAPPKKAVDATAALDAIFQKEGLANAQTE